MSIKPQPSLLQCWAQWQPTLLGWWPGRPSQRAAAKWQMSEPCLRSEKKSAKPRRVREHVYTWVRACAHECVLAHTSVGLGSMWYSRGTSVVWFVQGHLYWSVAQCGWSWVPSVWLWYFSKSMCPQLGTDGNKSQMTHSLSKFSTADEWVYLLGDLLDWMLWCSAGPALEQTWISSLMTKGHC